MALGIDRFVLQSTFGKIIGFFDGAKDNFFFGIIGTSVEEKVDLFTVEVTGIGLVIASEFTDIIFGPSIIPFPVKNTWIIKSEELFLYYSNYLFALLL